MTPAEDGTGLERFDVEAADGTQLAAWARGPAGGSPVVLVHGIGLDRRSWGAVPERLAARGLRVVAYDLRGHGESAPAAGGDYSLAEQGRDLTPVLDAAGADGRPAVLAGHSLGGGVLLAHAHISGLARVRAAVFVNTSGAAKAVPVLPRRGAAGPVAAMQRTLWLEVLRRAAGLVDALGSRPRVARAILRRWAFGQEPEPEDVAFLRALCARARVPALAATMRATLAVDPVDWAHAMRRPALVLAGTRDFISPLPDVRRLADALPDGRLVRIEGGGHMAALTHADEVAGQIAQACVDGAPGEGG